MAAPLLVSLVIPAFVLVAPAARADQPGDRAFVEPVSLPADDRQLITLRLLERYPELAASPGVKVAAAYPHGSGPRVLALVIFYPHTERHGIKEAFEARCVRERPSEIWACSDVEIRRYLQLASQDFEVRVKGELSSEAALALIEASRRDLQVSASDVSGLPDTAIMIMPHEDGDYFVTWGTPEGFSSVTMLAQFARGGDPVDPDDWHAIIFESPAEE